MRSTEPLLWTSTIKPAALTFALASNNPLLFTASAVPGPVSVSVASARYVERFPPPSSPSTVITEYSAGVVFEAVEPLVTKSSPWAETGPPASTAVSIPARAAPPQERATSPHAPRSSPYRHAPADAM